MLRLLPKKATYVAKNFGCCKGRSKLSVDIFMASGDLLVAQKSYFLQKGLPKTRDTVTPLVSVLRDIFLTTHAKAFQNRFNRIHTTFVDDFMALQLGGLI